MDLVAKSYLSLCVTYLCLAACGGGATQPPAAGANGDAAGRQLSAEECESGGGTIVGDIGDGAIHRPDYRCPSGLAPSGSIRAPEGGPMAVEGSVCCPKSPPAAP